MKDNMIGDASARREGRHEEMARKVYFVGIGGIGMAALARYYLSKGAQVAGYDRTPSQLTRALSDEGAAVGYDDDPTAIPASMSGDAEGTLVVYTPAVPDSNAILGHFRSHGFEVVKRAVLLGQITRHSDAICVSGSHGKTTTSSMTAHILHTSPVGCNAFLGGISRNYDSNLLLSATSPYSVIEADEYDRSFHQLNPRIAIVTSTDPDHLDIYGDEAGYLEGFAHFTSLIRGGGVLIKHVGLKLRERVGGDVRVITYDGAGGQGDCHAENVTFDDGHLFFDYVSPVRRIGRIELGVPVLINIDNAVAAITASLLAGVGADDVRRAMATFKGARRRFDIWLRPAAGESGPVLIDDYGHSPVEVKSSIASVRALWPERRLTVIFQPHLYTRTRDFAPQFAAALSGADEVLLCEIYPARELPIPGVSSELIYRDIKNCKKQLVERKDLLRLIKNANFDILMTLGAADLDRLLPDIKRILTGGDAR